jgi:hypothetical protein
METNFEKIGVRIPRILLPSKDIDLQKWAVVACDQYTSQEKYWKDVEKFVSNSPSTLNLIFPEVYLEKEGKQERINKIIESMREYLSKGYLQETEPCLVLVDRKTKNTSSRKGLILSIDLEKYDYNKGSSSIIRATEGTILARLPPRIEVRKDAIIELPHILVLIDDPQKTVIEPLFQKLGSFEKIYDFDLMMKSGHLKGYKISDEVQIMKIVQALEKLADKKIFEQKYNVQDKSVLLFAMGDGNHSLATAKAVWEEKRKKLSKEEIKDHPARFALVEIMNVHDPGLEFEPIHRVVFNVPEDFLERMSQYFENQGSKFSTRDAEEKDIEKALLNNKKSIQIIPYIMKGEIGLITIENPKKNLAVGSLQDFLEDVSKNSGITIDYIHGEDVVKSLSLKEGNIGFLLPKMDKKELFKTVILEGALPKKTFSMGEASEKRFYLESRKIA